MITTPWLLVGFGAALVLTSAVSYLHGVEHEQGNQARLQNEIIANVRAQERTNRSQVNVAIQRQIDEQISINRILSDDLERLHNRPERPAVPRDTGADCAGATGAELSREDAGAFVRLSADADIIRSALRACYAYADSLTGR